MFTEAVTFQNIEGEVCGCDNRGFRKKWGRRRSNRYPSVGFFEAGRQSLRHSVTVDAA
jgi:hypothetical protein